MLHGLYRVCSSVRDLAAIAKLKALCIVIHGHQEGKRHYKHTSIQVFGSCSACPGLPANTSYARWPVEITPFFLESHTTHLHDCVPTSRPRNRGILNQYRGIPYLVQHCTHAKCRPGSRTRVKTKLRPAWSERSKYTISTSESMYVCSAALCRSGGVASSQICTDCT